MAERLGVVLYRLLLIVAVLLALAGIAILTGDEPILSLMAFVPAGIAWGLGRGFLYMLAGE